MRGSIRPVNTVFILSRLWTHAYPCVRAQCREHMQEIPCPRYQLVLPPWGLTLPLLGGSHFSQRPGSPGPPRLWKPPSRRICSVCMEWRLTNLRLVLGDPGAPE